MEESSYAKAEGEVYKNPFDAGYLKNVKRVFGESACMTLFVFSWKQPPLPEYPFEPDILVERLQTFL